MKPDLAKVSRAVGPIPAADTSAPSIWGKEDPKPVKVQHKTKARMAFLNPHNRTHRNHQAR